MKGRAEGPGLLAHGRINGDSTQRHLHRRTRTSSGTSNSNVSPAHRSAVSRGILRGRASAFTFVAARLS